MDWLKLFNPLEWFKYLNSNPRYYLAGCVIAGIVYYFFHNKWALIVILSFFILWLFSIYPQLKRYIQAKKRKKSASEVLINSTYRIGNKTYPRYNDEIKLLALLVSKNIRKFTLQEIEKYSGELRHKRSMGNLPNNINIPMILDTLCKRNILTFRQGFIKKNYYAVNNSEWKKLKEMRERGLL